MILMGIMDDQSQRMIHLLMGLILLLGWFRMRWGIRSRLRLLKLGLGLFHLGCRHHRHYPHIYKLEGGDMEWRLVILVFIRLLMGAGDIRGKGLRMVVMGE